MNSQNLASNTVDVKCPVPLSQYHTIPPNFGVDWRKRVAQMDWALNTCGQNGFSITLIRCRTASCRSVRLFLFCLGSWFIILIRSGRRRHEHFSCFLEGQYKQNYCHNRVCVWLEISLSQLQNFCENRQYLTRSFPNKLQPA